LGRMTALAAARLGYSVHVFCPDADAPAFEVSAERTVAPYENVPALGRFAAAVDLITVEFENIPVASLELLAGLKPVRPAPTVVAIAQDRLREKDFLVAISVPTTRYLEVGSPKALERALRDLGRPAVLKTARFGYDGKGQVRIEADMAAADAWLRMGAPVGILEGFVDFALEISVVVARGLDGQIAA